MISTCLLITGPRSASGSVPEFTFRALARTTSSSSLEKVYVSFVINKYYGWLQSKSIFGTDTVQIYPEVRKPCNCYGIC